MRRCEASSLNRMVQVGIYRAFQAFRERTCTPVHESIPGVIIGPRNTHSSVERDRRYADYSKRFLMQFRS